MSLSSSFLTKEVIEIATDLRTATIHEKKITVFESLQIAVLIQKNELYRSANVMDYTDTTPVAFEKIAIELNNISERIGDLSQLQL